jgi:hypothetical protein
MANYELEAYAQHIDRSRLDYYIERQRQLFEAAKPALLERYLGEYVAFEDGRISKSGLSCIHEELLLSSHFQQPNHSVLVGRLFPWNRIHATFPGTALTAPMSPGRVKGH